MQLNEPFLINPIDTETILLLNKPKKLKRKEVKRMKELALLEETPRLDPAGFSRALREAWKTARTKGEALRLAWKIYRGGISEIENPRRVRRVARLRPRLGIPVGTPRHRITAYRVDGIITSPRARIVKRSLPLTEIEEVRRRVRRRPRGLLEIEGIEANPFLPYAIELTDIAGAGIGAFGVLFIPKVVPLPAELKSGIPAVIVDVACAYGLSMIARHVLKDTRLARGIFIGGLGIAIVKLVGELIGKEKVGLSAYVQPALPEGKESPITQSELSTYVPLTEERKRLFV